MFHFDRRSKLIPPSATRRWDAETVVSGRPLDQQCLRSVAEWGRVATRWTVARTLFGSSEVFSTDVARWHWEPQDQGRPHAFGYRHRWRVDFWIKPRYVGYPALPESQRMAFFGEGKLREIFAAGGGAAPLDVDAWSPVWVDPSWQPRSGAPPR